MTKLSDDEAELSCKKFTPIVDLFERMPPSQELAIETRVKTIQFFVCQLST